MTTQELATHLARWPLDPITERQSFAQATIHRLVAEVRRLSADAAICGRCPRCEFKRAQALKARP